MLSRMAAQAQLEPPLCDGCNSPITSTSSAARCDAGTPLGAVASTGSINWYNLATGEHQWELEQHSQLPVLVQPHLIMLKLARLPAKHHSNCRYCHVTITPTISSTTHFVATRYLTLEATASGTINWYDVSTGGTVSNGTTFTTQVSTQNILC
jgi:hypothetical protein